MEERFFFVTTQRHAGLVKWQALSIVVHALERMVHADASKTKIKAKVALGLAVQALAAIK